MTTAVRITHRGGNGKIGVLVRDLRTNAEIQAVGLINRGDEFEHLIYDGIAIFIGELKDPVPTPDEAVITQVAPEVKPKRKAKGEAVISQE